MLSSVLRSKRAVLVNIEIMRAFVRMRQILATHSSNIQPAYELRVKNRDGKMEFIMGGKPSSHSTRLGRYIAELFRPGERTPFSVQTAGREILAPAHPSLLQ